jgi:hypothetical protein
MEFLMDLFYQGSFKEQVLAIKKSVLEVIKAKGVESKEKLALVFGVPENVGNNILFITPPYPGGKFYEDKDSYKLKQLAAEYKINKYFITYCCHYETRSRKDIKEYKIWIHKIIDVVQPTLIVCLGEHCIFSLFKRKVILRDSHGKIIDKHEGIPVMITYPVSYYTEKSEYEDIAYKTFLKNADWDKILEKYKELIKC